MAKKKSVVEKIVDAVDHVIHPDPVPVEPEAEVVAEKSSDVSSDYARHPKFAKFSKKGSRINGN